ncbi:neprilysin-1-like [Amblyomma americanum]
MSKDPSHQGANARDATRSRQELSDSGSLHLTELQIAAIQGRLRSQVLVARSPARLPHVAVCAVGFFTVFACAAVATYQLHLDEYVAVLFQRTISLLRRASSSAATAGNVLTTAYSRPLAYSERNALLNESSCKTDACIWAENYLRGKLNWSVDPCTDFYAHVCSHHWMAHDLDLQSRVFREMTVGVLMRDMENFFQSYLKENQVRSQEYPGVFLLQVISLLSSCQAETKNGEDLTSMRTLLAAYNLRHWPYNDTPGGTTIVNISASLDRDLGVFPFVKVSLRKLFSDDRGYMIHVDAPSLTLKRYNLAYLGESVANFTEVVALALSLLDGAKDVREQAEAIALLERQLHRVTYVPHFVKFQDLIKRVEELQSTAEWDWTEYLTILLQGTEQLSNATLVAILNHHYVSKLAFVLNEADTTTLLNYVGYRLVVHMSPLLATAANPLLRLSHDYYLESVPYRQQACMHLLERLYKHGMHFFSRMALANKNFTFFLTNNDHSTQSLEDQLKSSVTGRLISSSSWLQQRSTIDIAVSKIDRMQFDFLDTKNDIDSIATYYDSKFEALDPSHLLDSFRKLQAGTMRVYWKSTPANGDLDARYDLTSLTTGHEYHFGQNVLFLPLANFAFLSNITKTVDPILIPLIMAEVFRGMFAAVDRRGASVHPKLVVVTWWTTNEMSKFLELEQCFRDQYDVEIRDMTGGNIEARLKREENIADNAALGPLRDMYIKALSSQDGADRLTISVDNRQLDMERLFFVLYAVGLCDNPNRDLWARKLDFGEIPGRLRVNIPLMNFAAFSTAFGCPAGAPMNPARKCVVW